MNLKVEMYTGPFCSYCVRAKKLLNEKKIKFLEIDLSIHPNKRKEIQIRSGGRITIPQIFINKKSIGGYDELYSLHIKGKLDKILNK